MADSDDQESVTTAITCEEQMRGWLAQINRLRDARKQVAAYSELTGLLDFFGHWTVLPFDDAAADQFINYREQRIRAGTMDLKIEEGEKGDILLFRRAKKGDKKVERPLFHPSPCAAAFRESTPEVDAE